jgi:hypothetical protein
VSIPITNSLCVTDDPLGGISLYVCFVLLLHLQLASYKLIG